MVSSEQSFPLLHHMPKAERLTDDGSIGGASKTLEDTKMLKTSLPLDENGIKHHGGVYFVHKILHPEVDSRETGEQDTELVGKIKFRRDKTLPLPTEFTVPSSLENGVLCLEVGYSFLGGCWGQGYATESLAAVLKALKEGKEFLAPFNKLYVEGVVSHENPGSIRVLEKVGMKSLGMYSWEGDKVLLCGALRDPCVLIYGQWLIE